MSSDFELLAAWSRGEMRAGDELFERHFESLYRFFRNKVSHAVHDLVQDTLLRCTESKDAFRKKGSFRAFLFGIARRVLHDHLRKVYRDGGHLDLEASSAMDLAPSPSQLVAKKQEHRILLQALRMIPLDHQIALELAYWEDMTGPEIGEVLGVPPATARTRLRRAREALTQKVSDLANTPELLESTMDNLDHWAKSLREYLETDTAASAE